MRETGIHAESERFVQSYKCSSGIFTQQGSTVVYKEKQINLHNMESVHTRILTWTYMGDFLQRKRLVQQSLVLFKMFLFVTSSIFAHMKGSESS